MPSVYLNREERPARTMAGSLGFTGRFSARNKVIAAVEVSGVACQGDGTTSLPRAWDHLEVLVSIAGLAFGVNAGAPGGSASLSVGGSFDDEGVGA